MFAALAFTILYTLRIDARPYASISPLEQLAYDIDGNVLTNRSIEYESVRQQFDPSLSRSPAVIIQCTSIRDIRYALQYTLDNNLEFVIRSGAHSTGGFSTCDGCVMIDLRLFHRIKINENDPIPSVQVSPGVRTNELFYELEFNTKSGKKYWLPAGVNNVGLGGNIHGGGWGIGLRKYGMSIDSLIEAKVLTVDCSKRVRLQKASLTKNPDLFYCIRGAHAPSCGIVVEYKLKIYEQNENGYTYTQIDSIGGSFDYYSKLDKISVINSSISDQRDQWIILSHEQFPSNAFILSRLIFVFYDGDVVNKESQYTESMVSEIHNLGGTIVDVKTYHGGFMYMRCLLDENINRTRCESQEYLRTVTTPSIGIQFGGWLYDDEEEYNTFLNGAGYQEMMNQITNNCPPLSIFCGYYVSNWGGKMNEIASDATAFPWRDTQFDIVPLIYFPPIPSIIDIAYNEALQWTIDTFTNTLFHGGFTTNRAYNNFLVPSITEEEDYLPFYYGDNVDKIIASKCKWDPNNIFTTPQGLPVDTCWQNDIF